MHLPATFSMRSNIPGFETSVHMQSNGNPQNLVDEMELEVKHSKKASPVMSTKFKHILLIHAEIGKMNDVNEKGKIFH